MLFIQEIVLSLHAILQVHNNNGIVKTYLFS